MIERGDIMAYMKIHCNYCGGTWEIYHRDNWHDDKARQCPHGESKIDRQLWEKEILPAFGAAHDANAELFKDHVGFHRPLFTVDFVADHIFTPRNCVLLDRLQDE